MKFGKNLAHLSIPEWKVYNLDYNELKRLMREVTSDSLNDLSGLYHAFVENFDYLNLFVQTKRDELKRRLKACWQEFHQLLKQAHVRPLHLSKLSDLHFQVISEVSADLRKLVKFILVQKIALKKIFKKFAKHHPDPALSKAFIASLTHKLSLNPHSFINVDLLELTENLFDLLHLMDRESRRLHECLQLKRTMAVGPTGSVSKISKRDSFSTINTNPGLATPDRSYPDDIDLVAARTHVNVDKRAKFDLVTVTKKNFRTGSLVANDVSTRNELGMIMDIYLSIPKMGSSKIVTTYLFRDPGDVTPSSILSYDDLPYSVVVAFTGGLRKYSYCSLPNAQVEQLLEFLLHPDSTELHKDLLAYIERETSTMMAKITINTLVQNKLTPRLRTLCERSRYFIHKDPNVSGDIDADNLSILPEGVPVDELALASQSGLISDNKSYEDNFYICFDEKIHSTNHITPEVSFDPANMDPFPYNTLTVSTNDSNLHKFDLTLTTEVRDNQIITNFELVALRKTPVKVQSLLKSTPVHLFKDLSLYDYMRSCYFNEIPDSANNHYSIILRANLLKKYENVDLATLQNNVDERIIQDKTRTIIKRQMSYRSLQDEEEQAEVALRQEEQDTIAKKLEYLEALHAYDQNQIGLIRKFNDLENLDNEDEEDLYFVYLTFNTELDRNILNTVILSFVKLKHRIRRALYAFKFKDSSWKSENLQLFAGNTAVYDSINEDPTFFNSSNDYQIQLMYDYDHVLSIFYFTLTMNALFITGINIGIVYGLVHLDNLESDFEILNNPLVLLLLTLGYAAALIFSMSSINLCAQRFSETPHPHTGVLWAVFIVLIFTILWSVVIVLQL